MSHPKWKELLRAEDVYKNRFEEIIPDSEEQKEETEAQYRSRLEADQERYEENYKQLVRDLTFEIVSQGASSSSHTRSSKD